MSRAETTRLFLDALLRGGAISSTHASPVFQALGHCKGDFVPGFVPFPPSGKESVVRRVNVSHVGSDGQEDGVFLEIFRGGATADAAGVLAAGVLGDGRPLDGGAAWEEL